MTRLPEGNAIVYCEGAFGTPNGKTAHGLVRRTDRYKVLSVVDSGHASRDAGTVLDSRPASIPVFDNVGQAVKAAKRDGHRPTHLVIGLAPDGGRLNRKARADVKEAIQYNLNVDSGLHDFLSEDAEIAALADWYKIEIRDIRKPPPRNQLHFFSGKIDEVDSFKVAVLGTDSAVGKRTTAWILVDGFRAAGKAAELIGTGQTAWMQGAAYSIVIDSLVNDFVAGEIEHAVWSAWNDVQPDVIVIEGQGSLMNPAYPGGFEILAAGRPDVVVLQHAPARVEYDGFPGYRLHSIQKQIEAIELLSGKPVVAITINHENLDRDEVRAACQGIRRMTGLVTCDPLLDGFDEIVTTLIDYAQKQVNEMV